MNPETRCDGNASAARLTPRTATAVLVVLVATFVGQVDGFVVTVAAPSMQRELQATLGQVQLMGAAYVMAMAAGLVAGAALGDRWGRRAVFLWGVAAFGVASWWCGVAASPEWVVAARVAQGAAAAVLVPQEVALIATLVPQGRARVRALSWYGVALGAGVVAGLAGGGLITDADVAGLGWRAAFLVNVPVCAVVWGVGWWAIPPSRRYAAQVDGVGAVLTAAAAALVVTPLLLWDMAPARWLPVAALLGAVATVVVLVVQQRWRHRRGQVAAWSLQVLQTPGVRQVLAAMCVFFAGNAALFLVVSYYLQAGLGWSVGRAGVVFSALGVGFLVSSAAAAWVQDRWGHQSAPRAAWGLVAAMAALVVVPSLPAQAATGGVVVCLGLVGVAQGLVVAPLTGLLLRHVAAVDAGAASGMAAVVTQLGLAGGYTVGGLAYRGVVGADVLAAPDGGAHGAALVGCAAGLVVAAVAVRVLTATAADAGS